MEIKSPRASEIFLNGKRIAKGKAGEYCQLNRIWRNGDELTVRFDYAFRVVPMPDDPQMFVIFYGPTMLAFVSEQEITLQSSSEEIIRRLCCTNQNELTFELNDGNKTYSLRPLFDITDEHYSVYVKTKSI